MDKNDNINVINLPNGTHTVISNTSEKYLKLCLDKSGITLISPDTALNTADLRGVALLVTDTEKETASLIKRLPIESLYFPVYADFVIEVDEWGYYPETNIVAMFNMVDKEHYSFLHDVIEEQQKS